LEEQRLERQRLEERRLAEQTQRLEGQMLEGQRFGSGQDEQTRHAAPYESELDESMGSAAIVVGPEGGWSEGEIEAIMAAVPQVSLVSLGDGGVLRAETAALSALSIWTGYRSSFMSGS
jgi:RsmE family RNA methyltransferase